MNNVKIQYPSVTILITALLCILKLTGVIALSWWWCFCLIWLPFAILIGLVLFLLVLFILTLIVNLIIAPFRK